MYHGCISPGSTGLCRPVRRVSDCAAIAPARSPRFDGFRHRSVHPDTPVFRIWEQEAGSSNLPTPDQWCRAVSDLMVLRPVWLGALVASVEGGVSPLRTGGVEGGLEVVGDLADEFLGVGAECVDDEDEVL